MVRSKSEVLEWYRNADAVTRIDFVCDLLKSCLPCELRLIAVCTEELGRRNWQSLRAYEQLANSPVELRSIRDLFDSQARSKMAICLCLLRPSSQACASSLFELLIDASSRLLFDSRSSLSGSRSPLSASQQPVAVGGGGVQASVQNSEMTTATTLLPDDRSLLDDLLLLVTIAVHHPAFSVAQKYALVGRLEALKDALAAFDLAVTGGGSKSGGSGCGGRTVVAGGAVLPRPSAGRSAAAAAETKADGQPSSGRISRGAPASERAEPVQGGSEADAATTLQPRALQIPGDPLKEGSTAALGKSTAGCCSHCPSAAGFRVRSDLHRSASAANCADVSAALVSPSSGCISSGGSVCGSPGETRKLVASSHRTRVIGIRARGATADASTSSSSPDRDLPSASSVARHTGQRLEAGCTTGGTTRQSRRTSRSGRQRSPSPKCVSGSTPSSPGAAVSAGASRATPEPSACAAVSTVAPRGCRRQTAPRACSCSSSSCCCSCDSDDGSGSCASRNASDTSHCCPSTSMVASEPSAHAALPTPSAAGCSPVPMPRRTEVDVTAVPEACASALSEPEPTLSSLSAAAACCDSLPSTAASKPGAEAMTQLPDQKHCCCSAKDGNCGDAGGFLPAVPVSSEDAPPMAASKPAALAARVGGVEASPVESPSPRDATRPTVVPSVGVVPDDNDGSCDVAAAMPALLLSETASTTPPRNDDIGLPLKDDYFVRESSETLSDPVALSPSAEPTTSASSGSEELPYTSSSSGHGSDNSAPPYMSVACDYAAAAVGGSSAIAGPLVATGGAPMPLPPVPHAGYAMPPHHGPGGFMPGYGGMVYCYPMPLYYGGAPPARSRRGRGGSSGGNIGASNASAGHDLFYQPCMPPYTVVPQPMHMYHRHVPPVQPPLPPAVLSSQHGGEAMATGAAAAAMAACPRQVDSCYSCGYSGHTGAQCPALLQQQMSPRLASALGGFGLDLSTI